MNFETIRLSLTSLVCRPYLQAHSELFLVRFAHVLSTDTYIFEPPEIDDELRAMYVMALMPILVKPPPNIELLQHVQSTLLILLVRRPPDPLLNIYRIYDIDCPHIEIIWEHFVVINYYVNHPYGFFMVTGETVATFMDLVANVHDHLENRPCPHVLNVHNRVLLTLVWLRTNPTYYELSLLFGISV